MGNSNSGTVSDSRESNDYNPFNIPIIKLNSPEEFNPAIAMRGCPPLHKYKYSDFAKLPIEHQAAYADGVIRGSYDEKWFSEQIREEIGPDCNSSSIGGLAYYYLKTRDNSVLDSLNKWNKEHINNDAVF